MSEALSDIGLALVRKALEVHLPGGKTPSVLFDALSKLPEGTDVPRSPAELMDFVNGPLSQTLEQRLGKEAAAQAIQSVENALRQPVASRPQSLEIDIELGGMEIDDDDAGSSDWPELIVEGATPIDEDPFASKRPTLMLGTEGRDATQPVRVLVVARTARLAQRIRASFGGHRVTVGYTGEIDDCAQKLDKIAPEVVIVDGQDSPTMEPIDLGVRLATDGTSRLVVVWASDQPWGNAVVKSLDRKDVPLASVPRATGVDTMLDYIRARFR